MGTKLRPFRTGTKRAPGRQGDLPSGNVIWVTDQSTVQKAGPDYAATVEKVQKGLTLPAMQELNARVGIDKQDPTAVATQYLKEDGYIQ